MVALTIGCGAAKAPLRSFTHGPAEFVILVETEGSAEEYIKTTRLLSGANNLDEHSLRTVEERGELWLGYPDANYRKGVNGRYGMGVRIDPPAAEFVSRLRAANPGVLLLEVLEDGETPRGRIVGYSTVSGWPFGDGAVTELAFGG